MLPHYCYSGLTSKTQQSNKDIHFLCGHQLYEILVPEKQITLRPHVQKVLNYSHPLYLILPKNSAMQLSHSNYTRK